MIHLFGMALVIFMSWPLVIILRGSTPLDLKSRVLGALAGLATLGIGSLAVWINGGNIIRTLFFYDFWVGSFTICGGYAIWFALCFDFLSKKTIDKSRK